MKAPTGPDFYRSSHSIMMIPGEASSHKSSNRPIKMVVNVDRILDEESVATDNSNAQLTSKVIPIIILDVSLLFVVFGPTILFLFVVEPFHRGFFCNDETISLPLKQDTVSLGAAIAVCVSIPLIVFISAELVYSIQSNVNDFNWPKIHLAPRRYEDSRVPLVATNVIFCIVNFMAGIIAVITVGEVMKCAIGRLRPNFLDVCKPDWSKINCFQTMYGNSTSPWKQWLYVSDYECKEADLNRRTILDSRKSFPSSHSSTSMYSAMFIALYLEFRLIWKKSMFLKITIQLSVFILALWCSLSRITDNKHHWEDVLTGIIMGCGTAYLEVFYVWKLRQKFFKSEKVAHRLYSSILRARRSQKPRPSKMDNKHGANAIDSDEYSS